MLKKLRRDLDGTLDANFADYDKANTDFSDTINTLDQVQTAAGRKINFDKLGANTQSGTLLRRLLSNVQSRGELSDALRILDETVERHGGKFDDDIIKQLVFVDELERRFGEVGTTGIGGILQKEAARATRQAAAGDVAGAALGTVSSTVQRLRRKTDDDAFQALEEFLRP